MPERNIPRNVVILTAVFVAAFLDGFYAPIPGKRELLGYLMASLGPYLKLSPWEMSFFILLNNSVKSFMGDAGRYPVRSHPLVGRRNVRIHPADRLPEDLGTSRRQRWYCSTVCWRSQQSSFGIRITKTGEVSIIGTSW
jgi:hypothetical protein